jgi:NAD(P)-dependent dehydrogenase (short-subunit alcohol dehydrogenase family)
MARAQLYATRLTGCPGSWQVPVFTESLDVRDAAAIEALPAKLPQEFAEVDILVNNAGLALGTAPITEISTEVRLLSCSKKPSFRAAGQIALHIKHS